jgi:hypothetical protein
MEPQDIVARADARLYRMVDEANLKNLNEEKRRMPRYTWPKEVIMSPFLHKCSQYGIDFTLKKHQVQLIEELEQQRELGKSIYGKGYLVNDEVLHQREIAEKEIAEKEDAYVWELSDKERDIIAQLNQNNA